MVNTINKSNVIIIAYGVVYCLSSRFILKSFKVTDHGEILSGDAFQLRILPPSTSASKGLDHRSTGGVRNRNRALDLSAAAAMVCVALYGEGFGHSARPRPASGVRRVALVAARLLAGARGAVQARDL